MGEQNTRKPRHYVIVVHGIGEQKLNQTATEVVHRFAEVRQGKRAGYYKNLLPSYLSAQSVRRGGMGHGWSEFNGIPVDPADKTNEFDGKPATETSGRNFRFVDLNWQHILQRHQERYASPAEKWGWTVLKRIDENKGMVPKGWIPEWATRLLHSVVETAVPVKKLLSWRYPDLTKLMFDDYLGDVHLYADYARTRGRAVRHFHVVLDEMHVRDFIDWCHRDVDQGQHNPYQPPVYTIIAHSLGGIMSLDALVYAHAREEVRKARASADHPCPSLPFPGYTFEIPIEKDSWAYLMEGVRHTGRVSQLRSMYPQFKDEHLDAYPKIPLLLWRGCVTNFITLGSPIDKYHVIWFQNYYHMGLRRKDGSVPEGFNWWEKTEGGEKRADAWLDERETKIVHYNLCDEQDPVGHHLDVAQASVTYDKVFDTNGPVTYRDVVFRRYAVPVLAHVEYWEDGDLFKGIVKGVIDGEKVIEGPDPDLTEYERQEGLEGSYFLRPKFRDRRGAYEKALLWAYFRVPFLAALLTGGLLSYGLLGWVQTGFGISYLAAIVAAILLWRSPRPVEGYVREARPEEATLEVEETARTKRWKFKRSILAHFVAGMVEWRWVLILLSEGKSNDRNTSLESGMRMALEVEEERTGRFWKRARKRYIIAGIVLVLSAALVACPYLIKLLGKEVADVVRSWASSVGIKQMINSAGWIGWIGVILSLSYLGTMAYARHVYKKVIKRKE